MIPYLEKSIGISVIAEMEFLSFPKITDTEEMFFKRMIENCDVISLDENVKRQAIKIRRTYGIQNPTSTGLPHDYTKTRNAKRKGTSLEHQPKVFVRDDKILSGRDG